MSIGKCRPPSYIAPRPDKLRFQFQKPLAFHPPSTFLRGHAAVMHAFEVRPQRNHRGVDLFSDELSFGRLWYDGPQAVANAIGHAQFYSCSYDAVIRVHDDADNVIETHEHKDDFKEW